MRGLGGRAGLGRWRALLIVTAGALALAGPARAEEGGFLGFLASAFGGRPASVTAPTPAPSDGEQVRPLTVRRNPKKAQSGTGHPRLARVPGKTGPVSIYEDPTLRDGDAVMTKNGMKVFAGGHFAPDHPYDDSDFVAVSASKAVTPNLKKTVIELNKLPHG